MDVIDKNLIEIVHLVYRTLPWLSMKFPWFCLFVCVQAIFSNLNWTWPDCSWFSIYFRGINRQVQLRLQKIACISLYVLVKYRNILRIVKSSLTHTNLGTEMSKKSTFHFFSSISPNFYHSHPWLFKKPRGNNGKFKFPAKNQNLLLYFTLVILDFWVYFWREI
jgi:hypothetical protein